MTAPAVTEKIRSITCRHPLTSLIKLELESGPPRATSSASDFLLPAPTISAQAPELKPPQPQLWVSDILGPKHHGSLHQYRKIIVTLLTRRHPQSRYNDCVDCECHPLPF